MIPCPACGAEITVGGIIDHFTLVEVAGRGGMGVVYRALDGSLDRHVALKLLRRDHSDNAGLIAQLEAEAAITASINHPHVVKVYSTGTDRGRFYIAMELVDKGSLDDLIRIQGRVAEAQVLEVAINIAQGLRAAHESGLIHRDVKPGNILFSDAHTAKIVDFGLAIFMAQEESVRGEIWGTPYYVAPEKLDEKPEDFRSDIYSLGASLFHAIAGRPPFEAESASLVALKHLKSQPVSLQAFAPHVSGRTAYIINRTLLKDPDSRYQSYDELIEHLQYAREELSSSRENPQAQRVVLEDVRHEKVWGWVTTGMIAVVLLAISLFYVFRGHFGSQAESRGAADPMANAIAVTGGDLAAQARQKLASGDATGAAEVFRKILTQPAVSEAHTNWLHMQLGLAELIAGRRADADAAFTKVRDTVTLGTSLAEQRLATFFKETAALMIGESPIAPASLKEVNSSSYEMFGLLLFGVKNWELGKFEDATVIFRDFRNVSSEGPSAWIASLKPLGSRYIDNFTSFQMAMEHLKLAKTVEQKAAAADELRNLKAPFSQRVDKLIAPLKSELATYEKLMAQPPLEGRYKIINRKTGRALDVSAQSLAEGANVQLWDYVGAANQQWNFTPLSAGDFKITAEHSSKALETAPASGQLRQAEWNGKPVQKWRLEPAGRGYFQIRSVGSRKALALNPGEPTRLTIAEPADSADQQWRLVMVAKALAEWTATDIGRVGSAGATERNAATGVFSIRSGGVDIWGAEDAVHFVYQRVAGDFDLVARVVSIAKQDWAKAGVIVRESLAPNARNVVTAMASGHGVTLQRRQETKGPTTSLIEPKPRLPHWVKLARRGEVLTGFHSADGNSWEQLSVETLPQLSHEVFAGIGAVSHAEGVTGSAEFGDVKITPRP